MDLKEAIYSRRSVREFTAETVSEKIIRDLIEAAVQAPSSTRSHAHSASFAIKQCSPPSRRRPKPTW